MNGAELAERVGVTYRQVDHWSRLGYLRPSNPGCGQGRQRDYLPAEVDVAVRMGRLVRAGLSPAVATLVARGDARAIGTLKSALGWSA